MRCEPPQAAEQSHKASLRPSGRSNPVRLNEGLGGLREREQQVAAFGRFAMTAPTG